MPLANFSLSIAIYATMKAGRKEYSYANASLYLD